ncbi:MAG: tetratricopeptide repeat protein [Candidatus Zixiibacteriota bacterium]
MIMTINNRKLGLLILILSISLITVANAAGTAGQGGTSLRYGASARSLAMGGALGTIATGGDALYYNPAGLGLLERWQFEFMHSQLWLDTRVNYGSFSIPVKNVGGFSIGVVNMGITGLDGRDKYNNPTGDFDFMETGVALGFGRWFMARKFRAGIVARYNMLQMDDQSAGGLGGFDVGIVSKSLLQRKVRLGVAVQNLGAGEIDGPATPITVRAGGNYSVTRKLVVTAEGVMVMDGPITPHAGIEYNINKMLSARAGYSGNDITFGIGISLDRLIGSNIGGTYQSLDYAGAAMNPIDNNFVRVSLNIRGQEMTNFWELLEKLQKEGSLCDNQSQIETFLEKDGAVGAKANIVIGECLFNDESIDAPLAAEPKLADINNYFDFAYRGLFGSDWANEIVTNEELKQRNVFSQKTHYMFAETEMADEITPETKNLIQELVMAGGDSVQYDIRLQYDQAYCYEYLGKKDSAVELYRSIVTQETESPVKYLALLRLGALLTDEDKDAAIEYLDEIITNYSYGFYNDDGSRKSYPFFPKKFSDNAIVDNAILNKANILNTKGETEEALAAYLDIVYFYPNLEQSVIKEAIEKAALCYEKLGNTEAAEAMRKKL